jgi:hypothetical protein
MKELITISRTEYESLKNKIISLQAIVPQLREQYAYFPVLPECALQQQWFGKSFTKCESQNEKCPVSSVVMMARGTERFARIRSVIDTIKNG